MSVYMKRLFCLILIFTLSSLVLSAQRTMKGQFELSAEGYYTFSSGGCDISFGQYLINSYWDCGISTSNRKKLVNDGYEDYRMDFSHLVAYGDFMYRLVGTRNRSVSLYGGGGVFLGYEAYDTFGKLPDTVNLEDVGMDKGSFLYGIHAKLEMEAFIAPRVALLVFGRIPWNFSSPCRKFCYEIGGGLRYNF